MRSKTVFAYLTFLYIYGLLILFFPVIELEANVGYGREFVNCIGLMSHTHVYPITHVFSVIALIMVILSLIISTFCSIKYYNDELGSSSSLVFGIALMQGAGFIISVLSIAIFVTSTTARTPLGEIPGLLGFLISIAFQRYIYTNNIVVNLNKEQASISASSSQDEISNKMSETKKYSIYSLGKTLNIYETYLELIQKDTSDSYLTGGIILKSTITFKLEDLTEIRSKKATSTSFGSIVIFKGVDVVGFEFRDDKNSEAEMIINHLEKIVENNKNKTSDRKEQTPKEEEKPVEAKDAKNDNNALKIGDTVIIETSTHADDGYEIYYGSTGTVIELISSISALVNVKGHTVKILTRYIEKK